MPPKRSDPKLADITNRMEEMAARMDAIDLEKNAALARAEAAEAAAAQAALAQAAAQAAVQAAQAQPAAAPAQPQNSHDGVPDDSVRRPTGKFSVEDAMGLGHDKFKELQSSLHRLADRGGLDEFVRWNQQPPATMARLYRAMRDEHPELRRFKHSWATADLARMFLKNRRAYQRKKERAGKPARRAPEHESDDEDI